MGGMPVWLRMTIMIMMASILFFGFFSGISILFEMMGVFIYIFLIEKEIIPYSIFFFSSKFSTSRSFNNIINQRAHTPNNFENNKLLFITNDDDDDVENDDNLILILSVLFFFCFCLK